MKTVRLVMFVLAALGLVLSASALPAAAAVPGNTFPGGSSTIDNQTHSISASTSLWYSFNYAGDRSSITLTLVNGNNSGVGFNVFTPAQIGDWWETKPIGRGTVQSLDCATGLPQLYGGCQSNDLVWIGDFNASDMYYVEVVNSNSNPVNFQLTIAGSGVIVAPQTAGASMSAPQSTGTGSTATTSTAMTAMPGGSNTDPGHALVIDNNSHTIPGSTGLWYRFEYAGDRSEITVTMPNGTNSGLEFSVFTPYQIGDWWEESPIGRGTAQAINCNTGLPEEGGACQANDLTWVGNFNAGGTYYVQVYNNNAYPMTGTLMIQGSGVTLGQ